MYWDYLKEHRPIFYDDLILSCKLLSYLAILNEQAQEWLETIITQMAAADGITEELKTTNQLAWVQRMNSIRARAE